MRDVIYLSAQPATDYYAWQVAVMLRSFLRHGIYPEQIHVVQAVHKRPIPQSWRQVVNTYRGVRFFWYEDERAKSLLPTTVRPHVLAKHWVKYPELENQAVFWHDCDIALTRPPNWDHLAEGPVWCMSDTRSYVGAKYVKSKGEDIYQGMCNIMGLCPNEPVKRDAGAGGAQVIMKDVTRQYWLDAERDIQALYDFFKADLKVRPKTEKYNPIQKWTAGMWATLWGAWRAGHATAIASELDFCWPHERVNRWDEVGIFHNSGVKASGKDRFFYKGAYQQKPPWGISNGFDSKRASYRYVEEVLATGRELWRRPRPCGQKRVKT